MANPDGTTKKAAAKRPAAKKRAAKKAAGKGQKAPSKAAVKRAEEVQRYRRQLQENEERLESKTNVRGEPLSAEQVATLREVINKQRDRLAELSGE